MYILILAGASGSGKSTLVKLICDRVRENTPEKTVHVMSMDQYYYSMTPGHPANWDHINAIDTKLLAEHLRELKAGKKVNVPQYDYVTHQRIPDSQLLENIDILILEGIFTLYDQELRDLADLKIYVEADPIKLCFVRRFHRDGAERGRSGDSIIDQYFSQVLPGYEQFVVPTKKYADLCYTNEGNKPTECTKFVHIVAMCVASCV